MDGADKEERRQRVRIGLTGLAFVFLLVLLGTAISRSGESPTDPSANVANDADAGPDDPLAQIGAAPGAASSGNEQVGTVSPGADTAKQ